MPVKKSPRLHYTRKKPAKHFLKIYHPYLPLVLTLALCLVVSLQWQPKVFQQGVLSYATNMSSGGLLSATNSERANNSTGQLTLNSDLARAAQAKADDMAARNYWSHNTPDGKEPWYFIDQTGYDYQKAGENLAYGFDSSSGTVAGWMNSPSHKDNMLDGEFRDVGFGIANAPEYQNSGEQTIVVAMYGQKVASAQTQPATAAAPTPTSSSKPAAPVPAPNPAPTAASQPEPDETPNPLQSPVETPPSESQPEIVASAVPAPKSISAVQAITGGRAPWSSFAVGISLGGLAVFLLTRHSLALHRLLIRGERFVLHHPLFDLTLVSIIFLGILLTGQVGTIL